MNRSHDLPTWALLTAAALVPVVTERVENQTWPGGVPDWLTEVVSGILILGIGAMALRRTTRQAKALLDANAALDRLAHTDPLTGLGNRAAWHEALDSWNAAPIRRWILVADVDRLKPVNDRKGHAAGDALLQRAAAALLGAAAFEESSLVFRTGGDEFASILATDEPAMAELAAIRILAAMRDDPDGASFSIGLACLEPGRTTAIEAARRADGALYVAKRFGGGNWRVASHDLDRFDQPIAQRARRT